MPDEEVGEPLLAAGPDDEVGIGQADQVSGLVRVAGYPEVAVRAAEQAVHLQTAKTARTYGFKDRGTIEPGMRADLNLVDIDASCTAEIVFDLAGLLGVELTPEIANRHSGH